MKSEWRAPKSTSVTGSNFGWTYVTLDRASQVARVGKQEMQEMQVQSLGREDPLEEEMATHSSILAWKIPWTEEPGGLQSTGSQRVRYDGATKHTYMYY